MSTNLTPVQKTALVTIATLGDQSKISERTLAALDSRGLITLDMDAYVCTDAAQEYFERIGMMDEIRATIEGTAPVEEPAPSKVAEIRAAFEAGQKVTVDDVEQAATETKVKAKGRMGKRQAAMENDRKKREGATGEATPEEAAPAPEKPAKGKTRATTTRKPAKRAMGADGILRKRIAPQLIAQFTKAGVQADVWNALQAEERESDGAVWLPVDVARLTKLLPVVEAIGENKELDGGTRRAAKAFVKRVNAHHLPLARKAAEKA